MASEELPCRNRDGGREVNIPGIQTPYLMTDFVVTRKELLYAFIQQPQDASVLVIMTLYNFNFQVVPVKVKK